MLGCCNLKRLHRDFANACIVQCLMVVSTMSKCTSLTSERLGRALKIKSVYLCFSASGKRCALLARLPNDMFPRQSHHTGGNWLIESNRLSSSVCSTETKPMKNSVCVLSNAFLFKIPLICFDQFRNKLHWDMWPLMCGSSRW